MSDERQAIEQEAARVEIHPFTFDDFQHRRQAKQRRERIATATFAALIAIAAVSLAVRGLGFGTARPASNVTWSQAIFPAGIPDDEQFRDVTYWKGMFLAAGNDHRKGLTSSLLTSPDGIHWEQIRPPIVEGLVTGLASDEAGRLIATGFDAASDRAVIWVTGMPEPGVARPSRR